jgi:hypothetical protein
LAFHGLPLPTKVAPSDGSIQFQAEKILSRKPYKPIGFTDRSTLANLPAVPAAAAEWGESATKTDGFWQNVDRNDRPVWLR